MGYTDYSDISLLESSNVLEEVAGAAAITAITKLASMIGAITSAGAGVYQLIKLKEKGSTELYYISKDELTASTNPTYASKSVRAAIIAYATKIGIKDGEKNTFFVSNKQYKKVSEEMVYLYRFDANMMATSMKNATFVDICKSNNINFEIKGGKKED
jgi:hypothetical protein